MFRVLSDGTRLGTGGASHCHPSLQDSGERRRRAHDCCLVAPLPCSCPAADGMLRQLSSGLPRAACSASVRTDRPGRRAVIDEMQAISARRRPLIPAAHRGRLEHKPGRKLSRSHGLKTLRVCAVGSEVLQERGLGRERRLWILPWGTVRSRVSLLGLASSVRTGEERTSFGWRFAFEAPTEPFSVLVCFPVCPGGSSLRARCASTLAGPPCACNVDEVWPLRDRGDKYTGSILDSTTPRATRHRACGVSRAARRTLVYMHGEPERRRSRGRLETEV